MLVRPWLVSVLGGECTGKTELCHALAERHLGLTFEETLRAWVERMGRAPHQHEQEALFDTQCEQERRAIERARSSEARLVLVDSGPLMTAVYSQVYFSDNSLLHQALQWQGRYDLTLVCSDDLPWIPDPGQRDGEEYRARAQAALRAALGVDFQGLVAEVHGLGRQRVLLASAAIERLNFVRR